MSDQSPNYFPGDQSRDLFFKVVSLTEERDLSWEEISLKVPTLPRGWYELSRLEKEDRIEFSREFWLSKLPIINPKASHLEERLNYFFENMEDLEILLTQAEKDLPFEVHMIYSMHEATGFFQGQPPARKEDIEGFKKAFGSLNFPPDYLAFLSIHNGFSKYTDTGLIKTGQMGRTSRHFQELLQDEILVRPDGQVIKPESLIPFYESFGLHCYQCFYSDWHLEDEMGNVYFSEHDRTISNFLDQERLEENLAFSTFLGWLVFYLEDIWHV